MIYAKIYLDKNKGRKDMLVFEATQTKSIYCQISWHISIAGAKYIAISPEAKSLFRARLEDMSSFDVKKYDGDFEMFDRDGGVFVFRPNEHGQMRRELLADERFTLCAEHGFAPQILDYMVPCDNDTLKSLDITTPIDETPMLEAYYTAKRALGEELGCDPDTISRTPFKFLTEEQKQRIKKEYHTDCDHFDSCDWHYHGDFIYDKIICGLMERFHKNYAEIELMIK
ncbi:MAG: hypothetical protein IKA82_00615 [Clostridia bacterium]|nr:hypothetical protein [Clostridia bacterium]